MCVSVCVYVCPLSQHPLLLVPHLLLILVSRSLLIMYGDIIISLACCEAVG